MATVKRVFNTLILSAIGMVAVSHAFADSGGWTFNPGSQSQNTTDPNSEFHYRLPEAFVDDVLPGQVEKIKLTPADMQQAASWGLSDEEEKRYLAIMNNQGSYYYKPHILKTPAGDMVVSYDYSPVEVLGVNARTDEERYMYAAKAVEEDHQYNAKFLAYNSVYHQASVALDQKLGLPIIKPFDTAKFSPYNYQPVALQSNDKLMLFVGIDDAVKPIVASLMGSIQQNPTIELNIYFVGQEITEKQVQDWAKSQNLVPEMVKNKEITLNFGNGEFAAIKTDRKLPVLILVRDGESRFVDTGRF